MGAFLNSTAPYTRVESWFYDTLIAPAVESFFGFLEEKITADLAKDVCVLDVGCGGGHLLNFLAKKLPSARLFGIDFSHQQVARAKRRLSRFGKRIQIQQGSALELPFDDNYFGVVLSVGSIKHWSDPEKGLSECARVLSPGGRLGIAEADRGCRIEDVDRFFKKTRIPNLMRIPFRVMFRLQVAGPAFDADDMREMAKKLPLSTSSVYRLEGVPAIVLDGIKN